MKRKEKSFFLKYNQLSSFMLTLLFLFISAAPALHSHHGVSKAGQVEEDSVYHTSDKCQVCDYCTHRQGKEFYLPFPSALSAPKPEPVTLSFRVYAGIYKFTLQGFTNKGPPLR